jgi:IS5 family transposase
MECQLQMCEMTQKLVSTSLFSFQDLKLNTITCHNPSLGFMTKARAYKGVNKEGRPRVTSHAPRNVGECEGMNEPSHSQVSSHFESWSLERLLNL